MNNVMSGSQIPSVLPQPVTSLNSGKILVMTRLYGYKVFIFLGTVFYFLPKVFQVKDLVALKLFGVDKNALLIRIAHCCAYQLLVKGFFNGESLKISF
jgi:predicted unusual protein kinase regulating ubiquinone biosynthesis (AarF/ABC1/UbiB family)